MKEAFKMRKYKAMPKALAVFVAILMAPIMITAILLSAALIVLTFMFKVVQTPIHYLKGILNSEGKEVHPATQFIIYFF